MHCETKFLWQLWQSITCKTSKYWDTKAGLFKTNNVISEQIIHKNTTFLPKKCVELLQVKVVYFFSATIWALLILCLLEELINPNDIIKLIMLWTIVPCCFSGIWTRDIRFKCNLLMTQVNKNLKNLESKKLIKAVKSVAVSSFCSFKHWW